MLQQRAQRQDGCLQKLSPIRSNPSAGSPAHVPALASQRRRHFPVARLAQPPRLQLRRASWQMAAPHSRRQLQPPCK